MKKHAYLIIAHGDFSLLSKLLLALDDVRNDLYVHIDAKTDFENGNVYHPQFAGIKYIKRMNVCWGGDSLIKCELALLKSAINGRYAYYHLLSGQDFPIKSQDYIHAFFDQNSENNYIKIDSNAMADGYHLKRVQNYYYFQNMIGRKEGHWIGILYHLNNISIFLQDILGVNRLRNCPKKIYKGTNWFSITHKMAELVLQEEPFIKKYCFFTFCADEIFLQTIAMNSHLSNTIVDSDLRCIDWIRGNPYTYIVNDYEMLMSSNCLFARKFSDKVDSEITNKILKTIQE